eukprot:4855856-Pyramimonas_sp.AAC.1
MCRAVSACPPSARGAPQRDLRSDAGLGWGLFRQYSQSKMATLNPHTARGAPLWDLRSDAPAACSSAP